MPDNPGISATAWSFECLGITRLFLKLACSDSQQREYLITYSYTEEKVLGICSYNKRIIVFVILLFATFNHSERIIARRTVFIVLSVAAITFLSV